MSNLKIAGALLAAVGALCLLLVQFLPWGGIEVEGGSAFGFSFPGADVDSYTWELQANSEDEGWYSDDLDGEEGVGQIRTAIPFLLAGLVVTAIGAIVAFVRSGPGGIVVVVGSLLALTGLMLFAMGTDAFYDSEQEWGAAFYLAIVGTALALIGGVLTLVARGSPARSMA